MLELKNVSKDYKFKKNKIVALKNVNLSVKKGEFTAIVGPSGSGKSTLLSIIEGILNPTSGDYYFHKEKLFFKESEMSEFRRKYVGLILQNTLLINHRTIEYNLGLPLKYSKISAVARKEKVEAVAESLHIASKLKLYPHMLSGGESQRVAIARAVIHSPCFIVADEPTSALDESNGEDVIKILKTLNTNGMTIIFATHDQNISR